MGCTAGKDVCTWCMLEVGLKSFVFKLINDNEDDGGDNDGRWWMSENGFSFAEDSYIMNWVTGIRIWRGRWALLAGGGGGVLRKGGRIAMGERDAGEAIREDAEEAISSGGQLSDAGRSAPRVSDCSPEVQRSLMLGPSSLPFVH